MTGGNKGVVGGDGTIGVMGLDEAHGGGGRGIDEGEAGEGEMVVGSS